MATTIPTAFQEYLANLEITDRQAQLVSNRRASVVSSLQRGLLLHSTSPSRLIGAYDRSTLIKTLSEGDVDVMVILNYTANKKWHNADGTSQVLDKFRLILDQEFPLTPKRRDRNCISMTFPEFRLDVVPAFMHDAGYYSIPDSIRKVWVPTNPIKFAEAISSVNRSMGGSFVPLIKMVKGWNRQHKFILHSFHLECMLYEHFRTHFAPADYPVLLNDFFASLPSCLNRPTYDPIMGDRIDTYLDNGAAITARQIAQEKANQAAAKAAEAYEDQTMHANRREISIREWKALLGDFFPAYG